MVRVHLNYSLVTLLIAHKWTMRLYEFFVLGFPQNTAWLNIIEIKLKKQKQKTLIN